MSAQAVLAKVDSKQFYRGMRSVLGPVMRAAGFRNLQGSQLGWARVAGDGWVLLWFQCDEWGWDAQWGSRFTVEFQQVARIEQAFSGAGRGERFGYVLEGYDELEELRLMNNAVIERLPGTPVRSARIAAGVASREIVHGGVHVDPDKAIYGRDLWLSYYTVDDVRAWARWFEAHLHGIIDIFEHERYSDQGLARQRFHQVMGRMQAAADIASKVAILAEHVERESEPHYRDATKFWLEDLRKRRVESRNE